MKLYDKVNYNNYEWKIIKIEDDNVILAMTNKLSEEDIQKYFTNKEMVDSDYDVRFSYDYTNNKWSDSYIRFVLNSSFLEQFNKEELNIMETNGVKDYVRLLTKEEVENMPLEERINDAIYGYWTMSPYYFSGSYASVFRVYSTGNLNSSFVNLTSALVPAISLKRSILEARESKNEPSFLPIEELNIENGVNRKERILIHKDKEVTNLSKADIEIALKINELVKGINELKRERNDDLSIR